MMRTRASSPRFVANASALIALGRINRLDLLSTLSVPIIVTETVWEEVTGDPTRPGVQARERALADGLLVTVDSGDPGAHALDPGESATLSAASAMGAAVILDERRARRLIQTDPALRVMIPATVTTVSLVVRAKRAGLVPEARAILDQLRRETFRLKQSVYEDALRSVGEWPEGLDPGKRDAGTDAY